MQTSIVKQLFQVFFVVSVKGEEKSRPTRCANIERQENLHKILERRAEVAVRGEKSAQQRLYEAEADVEVKTLGKEKFLILLFMRSIRSSNPNDYNYNQANQWVDQDKNNKISSYGELEMRNRLFRENQAKDCQEIEELRRICCEETDRAGQARIDELSMHQERNPTTVNC